MNDQPAVDIEELRKATGRETSASDLVTVQQCIALNATLDKDAAAPQAAGLRLGRFLGRYRLRA